jgi:hypothetical protein
VKNIGKKFSGSKGWHILVPSKSFPEEINGVKTKDMFPEWPRIISMYITEKTKQKLIEKITKLTNPSKYVKDFEAPKQVMPDIILVSSRHLFRMPYSLHEKTALASVVIDKDEISKFQLTDANPMKIKPQNFIPSSKKDEAKELLVQSLDWYKENKETKETPKNFNFKPVKLDKISTQNFPPCIKKILNGVEDGKKRSLFSLINLLRSVGMEKEELEKLIDDWNKKNNPPLKKGYIISQLSWSYRNKPIMPPNCKEFYQGIGVCMPDDFCKLTKNPVNYVIKNTLIQDKNTKDTTNFKKKKKL